ncbi:hypothetical protein BEUL_1590 [Bifidobacterium eulemuris]|uniref:Uncharacterized protein n=1 Tax=Bifidobacterium eulemuris TaxID=1765219 RepID=A0A261G7U1_9BIFI|nr:hypothetical protein BEUL_1590 [Bifidobacterium eulemuris]
MQVWRVATTDDSTEPSSTRTTLDESIIAVPWHMNGDRYAIDFPWKSSAVISQMRSAQTFYYEGNLLAQHRRIEPVDGRKIRVGATRLRVRLTIGNGFRGSRQTVTTQSVKRISFPVRSPAGVKIRVRPHIGHSDIPFRARPQRQSAGCQLIIIALATVAMHSQIDDWHARPMTTKFSDG